MLYVIAFVNGTRARPRRPVAPAAHVPDGRPRHAPERDRAQLEPLQRVAHLRAFGGRHPARLRRRRRVLPRQRDQLPRRAAQPLRDANAASSSRSRSSSGRGSSRHARRPRVRAPAAAHARRARADASSSARSPSTSTSRCRCSRRSTLHGHGAVYGFLSAVFGAGALAGALIAASRARASARVMIIGALVFTGAELLLAPRTERVRRRPAALPRRRRLHRVVGELERVDAARRAGPPARPDHRHLLLRLQRHRPGRRALRRLAVRARAARELAFAVAGVVGIVGTGGRSRGAERRPAIQVPRSRRARSAA